MHLYVAVYIIVFLFLKYPLAAHRGEDGILLGRAGVHGVEGRLLGEAGQYVRVRV